MIPSRPDWAHIDVVLLDMDGTLLDLRFDHYFWREVVPSRFAAQAGLAPGEAAALLAPRFAACQGSLNWYCIDYWSRELQLDIATLKAEVRQQIRFLPGAPEFLGALERAGKRRVLVTNAHQETLRIKAAQTGLADWFDEVVTSHAFGMPKEHPGFWRAFAARHPFEPSRALFIDDSLPVLRAARDYGIGCVWAVAKPDSTQPARTIEDFPAVAAVSDLLPIGEAA